MNRGEPEKRETSRLSPGSRPRVPGALDTTAASVMIRVQERERALQMSTNTKSWILALAVSLLWVQAGNASSPRTALPGGPPPDAAAQSCLEAARHALGADAEVLKCGHFTGTDALETVAAVCLKRFKETKTGVPVSKLVVLRREQAQWVVELTADRNWIRNSAGYIGIDFIDDSANLVGYRFLSSDEGPHEAPGFRFFLSFLNPHGDDEGIPIEISWNPAVGRLQELDYGHEPQAFKPEIKNPPHKFGRKSPA